MFTRLALLAAVICSAATCPFPSRAADAPAATPPSAHHASAAKRECMKQHLSGPIGEMKAHMAEYRGSHAGATRDQVKVERKAFFQTLRQKDAPQIQAARAACAGA